MILQSKGEPRSGVSEADIEQPGGWHYLKQMHFIQLFDVGEGCKENNQKGNDEIARIQTQIAIRKEKTADDQPDSD
jgi:hypothetical protein